MISYTTIKVKSVNWGVKNWQVMKMGILKKRKPLLLLTGTS